MKSQKSLVAAAGIFAGALAASPNAFAHASLNVGGYGDISVGGANSTGAAKVYTGGTTGGGISGSYTASGATGGNEVWTNGTIAEWTGAQGHPSATSNSVLPSVGYIGLHNNSTQRLIETGNYCGATASAECQANAVGTGTNSLTATSTTLANVNGDSLLRQVWNINHRAAGAQYDGGPSPSNLLPTDLSLSVAGNSWNGDLQYHSGMDVLNPHVSTGTTGNLEQNILALPAATGQNVYLNIKVFDDTSDNMAAQQLGFALYGGWDKGNGMSDLTLIGSSLAAIDGYASLSYQLIGTFLGEYSVLVGDNSSIGGQYKMHASITTGTALYSVAAQPVPIPAAAWLFGGALTSLFGLRRRKLAVTA